MKVQFRLAMLFPVFLLIALSFYFVISTANSLEQQVLHIHETRINLLKFVEQNRLLLYRKTDVNESLDVWLKGYSTVDRNVMVLKHHINRNFFSERFNTHLRNLFIIWESIKEDLQELRNRIVSFRKDVLSSEQDAYSLAALLIESLNAEQYDMLIRTSELIGGFEIFEAYAMDQMEIILEETEGSVVIQVRNWKLILYLAFGLVLLITFSLLFVGIKIIISNGKYTALLLKRNQDASTRIKKNEIKLRTLFDSSLDAILLLDPEKGYIDCNPAALKLFALESKEQLKNVSPESLSPTYQADGSFSSQKAQIEIGKAIENGENLFNWLHMDIHGKVFPASVQVSRIILDGKLLLQGVIRDLSNEKLQALKLQQLKTNLSNIINAMPSIIIAIDQHLNITHWNVKAAELSGIPVDFAIGKNIDSLGFSVMPEKTVLQDCMHTRESFNESKVEKKLAGQKILCDVSVFPVEPTGVAIRIDDVTERAKLDELIVQNEKMLSIGGMAAGMAHEINNPLAGMIQSALVVIKRIGDIDLTANKKSALKNNIDMNDLQNYVSDRKIDDLLHKIVSSGNRAAEIVKNMLSFAREEKAGMTINNPVDLVEECIELAALDFDMKKHYDFKQIDIIRDYDDDLPSVKCKTGKIEQVILNLMRNGAEAMHEYDTQKHQFVIGLKKMEPWLEISVKDNGPGIPEELLDKIFKPFFTTKGAERGTGLGLSVSYFIITDEHNGEMYVESEVGKGACFVIKLPLG